MDLKVTLLTVTNPLHTVLPTFPIPCKVKEFESLRKLIATFTQNNGFFIKAKAYNCVSIETFEKTFFSSNVLTFQLQNIS